MIATHHATARNTSSALRSEALLNGHVVASVLRNAASTFLVPAVALVIGFRSDADPGSAPGRSRKAAAESARTSVARLIGADRSDLALIASVSAAAGFVAAQFGPAVPGHNVVIGEREYSSNHFPNAE